MGIESLFLFSSVAFSQNFHLTSSCDTLRVSYKGERIWEKVPQGVITYLKRFYYDTALSAAPYALRSLQELVDLSHILFGSDYPFAREILTSVTIKSLKNYGGFDGRALRSVEQENALRLFPRLRKG